MIDFEVVQTALTDLFLRTVDFLPQLATTILVLLLGWIIARLLSALVKRLAERLNLDALLERTGVLAGLQRAEIKKTGPELLATFIFWMLFLNFMLIGLESLGLNAAVEPLRRLIDFLPKLLTALATLTVGVLLAQFLGKATQAAMGSMGVDFDQEVGQGVNVLLIVMIVIVVLEQLGIDASIMTNIVTNVITIMVAGLALAFGLGGRSVAQNVLAGFYAREQFSTGDTLIIDGDEGTLEGIGTLNSELKVGENKIIIPNTRLTEDVVQIK